jgi:membrane associated rhomboid family serine protease
MFWQQFADSGLCCYDIFIFLEARERRENQLEDILILILINVLVWIGVQIRPEYVNNLALVPADVWTHPWQILTSMFTHQDFFHILFNMWTLYFFGSAIHQLLGAKRFWIIYMIGGISGGIFYVLLAYAGHALSFGFLGNIYSGAIGASGAIFALGGALAVLRPQMKVMFFPIPVPMPLWIAITGSFLVLTFIPGVAWTAHFGGIVFGAAAGWVWRRRSY